MFRTRIRAGAKEPISFAGHYTVPTWGCGSGCLAFVIVDAITGKVFGGIGSVELITPKSEDDDLGGLRERVEYHPTSRLLKVNGCINESYCGVFDYEMIEGKGLKLIHKELLPKEYQPAEPLPGVAEPT